MSTETPTIMKQVVDNLNAATFENGYAHNYTRIPEEIVAEMHDWSGIIGFDPVKYSDLMEGVEGVTRWRICNPPQEGAMFMVEYATLSGWEATETCQNPEGETCRITYETVTLAQESIDDYVEEIALQIANGERSGNEKYYASEFRVVPFTM